MVPPRSAGKAGQAGETFRSSIRSKSQERHRDNGRRAPGCQIHDGGGRFFKAASFRRRSTPLADSNTWILVRDNFRSDWNDEVRSRSRQLAEKLAEAVDFSLRRA